MSKDYYVHPSTYVDEPVLIGDGTVIMHFGHLMPHCVIGSNCRIGRNVTIEPGVIVGNNVVIKNNVTLNSGVILEDNVICGQSIVFTLAPTLRTRRIEPETSRVNPTIVKIGANIGANSTIICGNKLGEYALIGAGSVITEPVPSYAFVYGNPAKTAGWACKCGTALNFTNGEAVCSYCSSLYRLLNSNVIKVA